METNDKTQKYRCTKMKCNDLLLFEIPYLIVERIILLVNKHAKMRVPVGTVIPCMCVTTAAMGCGAGGRATPAISGSKFECDARVIWIREGNRKAFFQCSIQE